MNPAYWYLAGAVIAEVVATSALKATHEFTRLWPSLLVVAGYCLAFYWLTLVLKTLPVGMTYAIWAGTGVILVTVVGAFIYKQIPSLPALFGMALIVAGVVIVHVYSDWS